MTPIMIRPSIVARSLTRLRDQKTHALFAGYLSLQQRAAQLGKLEDLQPEFLLFYKRFFEVPNHPLGTPYIKIFTEQKASERNLWLNEHVAGSYAQSSLRSNQPFRKVVHIEERRYSLPADHTARALEHLLYGKQVQAVDLAIVLYRDYGFLKEAFDIQDLISVFAYEFGYADQPDAAPNENFKLLFRLENSAQWDTDCLETLSETINLEMKSGSRFSPFRTPEKVRALTAEELLRMESKTTFDEAALALQQLTIAGLLSFGEETIFEFGRLNLLIGPNGSGKSNLIDCIRVLRLAPLDIQQAFRDSGFEGWLYKGASPKSAQASLQAKLNVPEPVLHRLRFSPQSARAALEEVISQGEGDALKELFIGSHRSGATLTVAGAGRRRRERVLSASEYNAFSSILAQIRDAGQYPEITHLSTLYSQFRIYSEWTFGRTSKLREATPTSRTTATLSESMDDLALALNALEKTAAHEAIRALLRELKETYVDYITRILFGRVGLELLESPFESPLPAQRLSDGTLRFLALAAILLQPVPPPLICLEEPELGMHPDMIRMVAKMIIDAASRTQLVVTTHSEFLLTSLQNDFDVLFAFDAGIAGSVVRRFSQAEYSVWREEHTLGELWTSGELGGNRW